MEYLTRVKVLAGVPLNPSQNDVLWFASADAQTSYFNGQAKYTYSEIMYVKNEPIYLPNVAGGYRDCNYIMFQNPDSPGKWFYAFIAQIDYMADDTTRITWVLDNVQTWMFEMEFGQCMIEREHVNDDTIGANIMDEGLATGPFVLNEAIYTVFNNWWLVVVTSVLFSNLDFPPSEGFVYSGIYSGLAYYCYDIKELGPLETVLAALAGKGKSDAVVSMYMIPKAVLPTQESGKPMVETSSASYIDIADLKTLNGYTPRNNKLLCWPYRAIEISNHCGGNIQLRYEWLGTETVKRLQYRGSPFPNGRIVMWPVLYQGKTSQFDYSISLGNYPQCSWIKDVYANWLATESVRQEYKTEQQETNTLLGRVGLVASSAVPMISSAVFGSMAPGVAAVGMSAWNQIKQEVNANLALQGMQVEREVASMSPPSAQGNIGGESTLAVLNNYGFKITYLSISKDYAQSIDNYFDMFGYKVMKVKAPNITGRPFWNYVKTIGAVVKGNIPSDCAAEMTQLLNRGIRFWHTSDIGNYSLANK